MTSSTLTAPYVATSQRRAHSALANTIVSGLAGLVFGFGLVIAGMTDPGKVQGFLDITGAWDPSLAFVMGGALAVHAIAYRLVKGRTSPLLGPHFTLPTRRDVDAKLVVGAALFGVGWGLGGVCPGPGLVDLGSGLAYAAVFVVAMSAGMMLQRFTRRLATR